MDGRKAVGGKLEVQIRVREPYVSKQVEESKEKWLVIDRFVQRAVNVGEVSFVQYAECLL